MPTDQRIDPYRTYNFRLEIDGMESIAFSECSGLSSDGDAVEYREGTDAQKTARKLVGLRKYSNITLKRGQTTNEDLWKWYMNIVNGIPDRRNGTIILMDEAGGDVVAWSFENGWPNKIEAPSLNATGNEVGMETLEICHEGLTMELA